MAFQPLCLHCLTGPNSIGSRGNSTNWEDDYIDKLDEYQRLGILEYWIVDYLALGSRNYLGYPKVPAVFVYSLDAQDQYQLTRFQEAERIISRTFPELTLTVEQILTA